MQNVESIIHARWIIPVEPEQTFYENYSLVIDQGKILNILDTKKCHKKYQSAIEHHLNTHALIPGFINTHTHAAMNLMRGIADDLPLMEWLSEHIWPVEAKYVDYQFVKDGTTLAIAEMLRCGTTTFNDMYFFPDATAKAAQEVGIRACVGLIVIDFPSAWGKDSDDYLHKSLQLHEQYRNHPLITTALAPHAPYTVSDEPLKKIQSYAEKLEIPIHMHLHETADELQQAIANDGMRPIERMEKLGLLSPFLMAVHMTQIDEADYKQLKRYGVNIIYCPESNLKLASGFCPIAELHKHKINIAIGTDGAASNNDLDMLSEMRTAALLAKAIAKDPAAVPAHQALSMATINGAKALGIDHLTGSLKKGKVADITAINLDTIETQPVFEPISSIIYSSNREQISDVWVQGKHLLNNRKLTTIDEKQVRQTAREWGEKLSHI